MDLDSPLQTPVNSSIKREIVSRFWGVETYDSKTARERFELKQYFRHYTAQSDLALHDLGRYVSARTHRDIVSITDLFKRDLDRDEIKRELGGHATNESNDGHQALNASIDLAVRLFLMLEVGRIHNSFSGHKELRWEHGSLQSFVAAHFGSAQALTGERVKFEKIFIARNLKRIAKIGIVWTDNLANHLCMLEDDTKVAIFHHASFLEMVLDSTLYPEGLIEETIRSLALLFPQSDKETKKWVRRNYSNGAVDENVTKCGHLRADARHIDNFQFWRDRLVILKQVFHEAEPKTLSQWWYDRRKGTQRYPFLIAFAALALTALFGLIQCVEAGLQVYKAYYPS